MSELMVRSVAEPATGVEQAIVPKQPTAQELRRVFAAFPTGVTAVAAIVGGAPIGLAASSFTAVSLDPPLVSVCVREESTTWPLLRAVKRCGVSVLAAHQEQACRRLGSNVDDRFSEFEWRTSPDGAVLIEGASAWLECSIDRHVRAGDHDIVLLRVHDLDTGPAEGPLVFHGRRFRRLAP